MFKKNVVLAFALSICLCLAACGSDADDSTGTTDIGSETTSQDTASPENAWNDGAEATTYESEILVAGDWGVLPSDDTESPDTWGSYIKKLQVTNSVIDTASGSSDAFGVYSSGACFSMLSNCVIGNAVGSELFGTLASNTEDYGFRTEKYALNCGAIVAEDYAGVGFVDGCVVTSEFGIKFLGTNYVRYQDDEGLVYYNELYDFYEQMAAGLDISAEEMFEQMEEYEASKEEDAPEFCESGITMVEGSTFNTKGAAFLIKACTPNIKVTNSLFNAENGVIVQLMTSDEIDTEDFSETLFTDAEEFAASQEKDPDYSKSEYNLRTMSLLDEYQIENCIGDVQVNFYDCNTANGTALAGDFFNSITVSSTVGGNTWWGQNLILTFDNCDVTGNCSSSAALHDGYACYLDGNGGKIEADTISDAMANGAVTGVIDSDHYEYTGNITNTPAKTVNNGVWVTLTNGSTWTPTETCYLTSLYVEEGCVLNADVYTSDGVRMDLNYGITYSGQIIVKPLSDNAE